MKNNKEVTIYDIARELNVSPTTVSRALKDHYSISKETTKAVKKLAHALGYQPNSIASSLRTNKTNTLGVLISWINRPFMASLISGIEEVANQAGYNVIISQSCDSYQKEIANANTLYASRVDGLIVSLAMETQKYDHFRLFQKKGIPVVFVDRVSPEAETDKIMIDNFSAAYNATEHLIREGCTRIAHLAGAQHRNIYKGRQQGYLEALKKYQLPIEEDLLVYSNLSAEEGLKSAEFLLNLKNPPDAVFSANDTAAVSVIQYAKKVGIKIPEELAIVGFNDDPIASIIDPPLTTMTHPAKEMGKVAARHILRYKENKDMVASETVILKTELLVRASSLRNTYAKKPGVAANKPAK